MAIARKPERKPTTQIDDNVADAFIAGAAKAAIAPPAIDPGPRKSPVMLRFDRELLSRVDTAAKRRGISRSAWIQFTVSRALDAGEG